jgi:hypothetical protein
MTGYTKRGTRAPGEHSMRRSVLAPNSGVHPRFFNDAEDVLMGRGPSYQGMVREPTVSGNC